MEGAYINMKLIIENRQSGTGNREPATDSSFLFLSKCVGYFKTDDRKKGIGNRELDP